MIDKDKEREYWKKHIHDVEKVLGYESSTMPFRQKRRVEVFIEAVNMREGKDILELGCGSGNYTQRLAESKAHIVAIDLSPELLNLAKAKSFANVEYKVGDAEKLPFKESSFDAVVGNSVLHHCNLYPALNEIKRVLRRSGKVIFSEPNMLNPHIFFQKNIKFLKRLAGDSPDETAFFRWGLKKAFVSVGFTDVSIKPFDFLHPLTPVSLINVVSKLGAILERISIVKEIAGSLIIYATVPEK